MQKEMRDFDYTFTVRQPSWHVHQLRRRLEFAALRRRAGSIVVGSHSWHLMQEKLSRQSSVGLDLTMRSWFYMATLKECGPDLCVFPGTIIHYPRNVSFGTNVFVNRSVFISAPAPILIGSQVLIGPYVVMNSGNHRYSERTSYIRDQGHDLAPITIGDDVWISAHVTVVAGVTVGTGAVIAAGAVVTRDVDEYSVVAGVPARPIGVRGSPP
jgi:acetyltransferase-like isoleucine patch superfamily enzyme